MLPESSPAPRRLRRPLHRPLHWAALGLLVLAGHLFGAATAAPRDRLDPAAIEAYVRAALNIDRVPGAAVAIVRRGELVYARGFGHDGAGGPVTPDSGFVLGSMSKAFTAFLVMSLVEEGKVRLDAPVRTYLPWFRLADEEAARTVTVAHALAHTTGLPARAPRARGARARLEDHVRALAAVRPIARPGERHVYASPNYLILGAIVERVTGERFADALRARVLAPLGAAPRFGPDGLRGDPPARGHRFWFGVPRPADLPHEADRTPTAAVVASAREVARFLSVHLTGGRVPPDAGERAGETLLSPDGVRRLQTGTAPAQGFRYAMGWRDGHLAGERAVHHGGVLPHYRGKMVMLPDSGWGVVVLTNASSLLPLPATSHRIADAVAAHLAGAPLPNPGSPFRVVTALLALGLALVTFGQLRGLARASFGKAPDRPPGRLEVLSAPLVLAGAALLAPRLAGQDLADLLAALPDVGAWFLVTLALDLATALARLARARHRGPRPTPSPARTPADPRDGST